MALTLTTEHTHKTQPYVKDLEDDKFPFDIQYEGSRHD